MRREKAQQLVHSDSGSMLTAEIGEWDSPALTPVTPHVSTPPRPLVLNDDPKTMSSFVLRMPVISSRHMLDMAAISTTLHMTAFPVLVAALLVWKLM